MSDIDTNGVTVETGENWDGDATIENASEIAEVFDEETWLAPDGDEVEFTVENPHLNGDPTYLRIKGHRKALWFHVIDAVHAMEMEVKDLWQHDRDKADDILCIRVEPDEVGDG